MSVAFSCRGLRVTLGGREVLHGVDLQLPAGRWTALAGPNGAGKTTLLKALANLLPSHGNVQVLGRPAAAWPARERARAIAWLGQGESGAEDLLVEDVVMLGRLPHQDWLGLAAAADREAVHFAMQETQCSAWRGRALGSLSGGERQRVLLARALAVQAPLLLMDEPLSHLDPPHQSDWLAIVRRHVARGGTAVSVLHEISVALQADDLVLLDAGRVVHHGSTADPATHRAVEKVFADRVQVHAVAGRWVALPREEHTTIAVVAYPLVSNTGEFQPLENVPGVQLRWARTSADVAGADWIILPGSTNAASDLAWLRAQGLDRAVAEHAGRGGRVLGICGGLQMLGEALIDPHDIAGNGPGLGLLPLVTLFGADHTVRRGAVRFQELAGPWSPLSCLALEGCDIHPARTAQHAGMAAGRVALSGGLGWQNVEGNVLGVYLHGLFEDAGVLQALFGVCRA